MPEDANTPQEGVTEEGQVSSEESQDEATSTEQDSGGEEKTFSEDYVKKLREEAASYRTRLKALEDAEKQKEDASKSEAQKLQEENERLKQENFKYQQQNQKASFVDQINLPNARWAYAAAQDLGIQIEFDDNNKVQNLPDIRKALKEADPKLFGTEKVDAGEKTTKETQGNDLGSWMASQIFQR